MNLPVLSRCSQRCEGGHHAARLEATPRARVEHVFGALAQMGGKLVRCLDIVRVTFALHLKAPSDKLLNSQFLRLVLCTKQLQDGKFIEPP
ncbi:hypothetical protein ACPJXG_09125 [Janthinobacterium sp. NFX145]|uniref:hypothetical protein n=1 Tax=Janthinobacterium sp. NFX145 TaxID=3415602 RepID=UPI003CC5AE47